MGESSYAYQFGALSGIRQAVIAHLAYVWRQW